METRGFLSSKVKVSLIVFSSMDTKTRDGKHRACRAATMGRMTSIIIITAIIMIIIICRG